MSIFCHSKLKVTCTNLRSLVSWVVVSASIIFWWVLSCIWLFTLFVLLLTMLYMCGKRMTKGGDANATKRVMECMNESARLSVGERPWGVLIICDIISCWPCNHEFTVFLLCMWSQGNEPSLATRPSFEAKIGIRFQPLNEGLVAILEWTHSSCNWATSFF